MRQDQTSENPNPINNGDHEISQHYPLLIEMANNQMRFSGSNGIFIDKLAHRSAMGSMEIVEHSRNPMGGVHGGALSTLADTVAGCAVVSLGYSCVTVTSTMNYLREVLFGTLFCSAEVVKEGRHIAVVDAKITDSEERLVATGTFTFFIKRDATS